jgi:hypothetical protein
VSETENVVSFEPRRLKLDKRINNVDEQTYLPELSSMPFLGLTVEYYHNGDVILYRLTAVSKDIVERWSHFVVETVSGWDKSKPYRAVHDLSQAGISLQYSALVNFDLMNVGINAEGRNQVEAILDQHPTFSAMVAMNFNLSLSGQTNRTLMNFLSQVHPGIQYKTFYNRNKCLRWLLNNTTDTGEMKQVDE